MEKLTLVSPSMDWAKEILAYKEAFGGEHLYGGSRLQEIDDLSDWLQHLERLVLPLAVRKDGPLLLPSSASERGIRPWSVSAISATTSTKTIC